LPALGGTAERPSAAGQVSEGGSGQNSHAGHASARLASIAEWTAPVVPAAAAETSSTPAAAPAGSSEQAAKIAELLSRQSVEFRQAGATHLTAVLKPDAGTELHVSLKVGADGIEMQARCDRGDSQALSAQWPEIQHAMAQKGIRLADLNAAPAPNAASQGNSFASSGFDSGAHRHKEQQQAQPGTEADGAMAGATTAAAQPARSRAASPRSESRAWETWA